MRNINKPGWTLSQPAGDAIPTLTVLCGRIATPLQARQTRVGLRMEKRSSGVAL
jgi:hypothetical protein